MGASGRGEHSYWNVMPKHTVTTFILMRRKFECLLIIQYIFVHQRNNVFKIKAQLVFGHQIV